MLARRLSSLPPLPSTGAAVAVIGAGGSGKSSCAAALACSYAHASTLSVTVASLRAPDAGASLSARLTPHAIGIMTLTPERLAQVVEENRRGDWS